MTDITILEFLQAGKFAEAISVMQRDGLLPTMNVIEMLVRNICDEGNIEITLIFEALKTKSRIVKFRFSNKARKFDEIVHFL